MSRRRFLALAAAAVAAPLALKRLLRAGVAGPSVILPPGAKPLERFMAKCSACGTCASVCPTKALSPTLGPGRMRMDYDRGYCDYGCSACMSACPTGALARLPLDEKKRLKLGSARLDESLCVPHSTGKPCGACASACPTGALASVRRKPVLDDARCIGCGLCQYVCMAWPEKAIRVEAVT
jgi:ferredoxin